MWQKYINMQIYIMNNILQINEEAWYEISIKYQ